MADNAVTGPPRTIIAETLSAITVDSPGAQWALRSVAADGNPITIGLARNDVATLLASIGASDDPALRAAIVTAAAWVGDRAKFDLMRERILVAMDMKR